MPTVKRPEIVLVAAVARNAAIGRDNGLIFRDAADLKHFREITLGHPVIMGRKTWDSLPPRMRPLPGRHNIVVSHDTGLRLEGAQLVNSLPAALAAVASSDRVFVVGGAQLYAQALPLAHTLELTEIDVDLEGDTFFPPWDRSEFERTACTSAVTPQGVPFRFVTYRRR